MKLKYTFLFFAVAIFCFNIVAQPITGDYNLGFKGGYQRNFGEKSGNVSRCISMSMQKYLRPKWNLEMNVTWGYSENGSNGYIYYNTNPPSYTISEATSNVNASLLINRNLFPSKKWNLTFGLGLCLERISNTQNGLMINSYYYNDSGNVQQGMYTEAFAITSTYSDLAFPIQLEFQYPLGRKFSIGASATHYFIPADYFGTSINFVVGLRYWPSR